MTLRASATCRCPACGRTFRVLADEYGDHSCPRCGHDPEREATENEERTFEECQSDAL